MQEKLLKVLMKISLFFNTAFLTSIILFPIYSANAVKLFSMPDADTQYSTMADTPGSEFEDSENAWSIGLPAHVSISEGISFYCTSSSPDACIDTSAPAEPPTDFETLDCSTYDDHAVCEMARALNFDPLNIYKFVSERIQYKPYYNLKKGAQLTLFDESGNDFDQASLLVRLLWFSGIRADFVYGTMEIPAFSPVVGGASLQNWLGLQGTASVEGLSQVLRFGCIPHDYQDTTFTVSRVWVRAHLDTEVDLDPAFKYHEIRSATEDVLSIIGFNKTSFMTDLYTVDDSVNYSRLDYFSRNDLRNRLSNYASDLVDWFADNPTVTIENFVGRKKIIPNNLTFHSTESYVWRTVPSQFLATIRVQAGDIEREFTFQELKGQELSVARIGDEAVLYVGDEEIARGDPDNPDIDPDSGDPKKLIVTINHKYAAKYQECEDDPASCQDGFSEYYADTVSAYGGVTDSYGVASIVYGFHSFTNKRDSLLAQELQRLASVEDTPPWYIRSKKSYALLAARYIHQATVGSNLLMSLSKIKGELFVHHAVGVVASSANKKIHIDVGDVFISPIANLTTGNDVVRSIIKLLQASTFLGSALESGIIQQLRIGGGMSTVKYFDTVLPYAPGNTEYGSDDYYTHITLGNVSTWAAIEGGLNQFKANKFKWDDGAALEAHCIAREIEIHNDCIQSTVYDGGCSHCSVMIIMIIIL